MSRTKTSSTTKSRAINLKRTKRDKVDVKETFVKIYPMMPRGYTAIQRALLRKFEKELFAGRKIKVE